MRVLIVEDDPLLGDALAVGLKQRGFEPDWVRDGREAQTVMRVEPFAAIILDLGLPGLTGLELLRSERARGNKVPVLILTARDAVQDRIKGLDSGADDYVLKPMDLDELAARLRALVRRSKGEPAPLLRVGDVALDPAAGTVTRDCQPIDLQPREFALLQELMLNAGRVLSREQLEERMYRWGEDEVDTEHAPVLHRYGRRVMFQVWRNGTTLGLHSQHAPDAPLSTVRDGFSDATVGGTSWRVFSTWDARSAALVQVAEQNDERDELATAVARNFVVPLAITLPVLGFIIWVAIGRATQSLTHINQHVASRFADNLTPLDVADAPSEIGALVTSLNQLFERVHGLIEQERRFTADAAHELRTPIAGIRVQAQVALRAAVDTERTHALDGVIAGCDRAAHTVEQMLTLARLAPDAVSFQPTPLELAAAVKGTISDLAPAALAKGMDIELAHEQHVLVSGDAGLLSILFRNVIDNALRYSAPGTKVGVDMEVADSEVRVTVRDAGPGIPADQRANVGRRFYRTPGTQAPGSGLGLSIVQRIADLHRGTIRLDSPATTIGLQVPIALPRVVDERA